MSYNNWNNNNRRNYANNYNNGNRNYGNNYSQQNQSSRQPRKHSGSKSGMDKNGNPFVNGWNYSRSNGLVSFLCTPYKGTKSHDGKTQQWENWVCKVTPKMAKPFLVSCLYSATTGKVIINDLGIVLNPRAANGGYCGKFSR